MAFHGHMVARVIRSARKKFTNKQGFPAERLRTDIKSNDVLQLSLMPAGATPSLSYIIMAMFSTIYAFQLH